MFDLVIRNARLIDGASAREANISVNGGRIAAVGPPEECPPARDTYDAAGRYVMPGLVDAHVHFRDPGPVHKEGFENGSLAAALGGVTTVIIMPTDDPMTDDRATFRDKIALGRRSFVDFGLNVIVGPHGGDLASLAGCGPCAYELFLADVSDRYRIADASRLLEALRAIAKVNGVAGVTPMLHSIAHGLTNAAISAGRTKPLDFAASRPPEAEALGVAMACEAAILSRCRVHIRQVSCRESLEALKAYRKRAPELITAETMPHNMFLDEGHLARLGPFAKMAPPLRSIEQARALVAAVNSGVIDIVVTDHAPHPGREKEAGRDDIWKAPSGVPGLETLLPVMLWKCLQGEITLTRLVDALSTKPAKLFGLFPRKGCIAPGSDADLIVVDGARRRELSSAGMKTRAGHTPFDGMPGAGSIDLVLSRGRRIAENGAPAGEPGGSFVRPIRIPATR